MKRPDSIKNSIHSACWGVVLCAACGIGLWQSSLGIGLENLSYDLPYLFREPLQPERATIVYLDEDTYEEFEGPKDFDRKHHADVLEHLRKDGATIVAFDIFFGEQRSFAKESDTALAEAIAKHSKVVLVSVYKKGGNSQVEVKGSLAKPDPLFLSKAFTGVSDPEEGEDGCVRRYYNGDQSIPGFAWRVAQLAGVPAAQPGIEPNNDLWLNYYGPPRTLRSVSFKEVTRQTNGFFTGQVVFIGSLASVKYSQEEVDEFQTPYTRWENGARTAGVEIVATAFLNLFRGESLRRMTTLSELRLLILGAMIFGAGLVWLRPWWAVGASVIAFLLIACVSCAEVWRTKIWFGWMFIAGVQLPVGLSWALFAHTRRVSREKDYLEETLTQTLSQVAAATNRAKDEAQHLSARAVNSTRGTPVVADHTLLKRVGKGGYGEVWLARNAIGSYHVVKLVHRRDFSEDAPYEREFRGIQKFMPISRSHPGFVHILQVGRNDQSEFFYCVMEAGDDEKTGTEIDPPNYVAKTLGSCIRQGGPLKIKECVQLGLALTSALEYLHEQKLIHRDIKPANIIYVKGQPKLADIGLVTDLQSTHQDVSQLGTEGFMAPEGPGSAAADVYSLGKVMYEACMGLDRRRFPELPTALYEAEDIAERMQLNRIILRACEPQPTDRYSSAAEMHADLADLLSRL